MMTPCHDKLKNRLPVFQPPDPKYTIRTVQLNDIYALRQDVWSHHNPKRCQRRLQRVLSAMQKNRGSGIVVLASDSKTIIAYGQMLQWLRCCEISDLMVAARYRGQGVGTAMIQYLVQTACHLHSDCIEIGAAFSNPRALALYRRLGFKQAYTLNLKVGANGPEPVVYLRLMLCEKTSS